MASRAMRSTWDALASAPEVYVGKAARGKQELDDLFGRLGADPRGGVCLEVGCGGGRMTPHLAERFDRVLGLDVSPAMIERASAAIAGHPNVELRASSGERLDGVEDASVDVLVCYLVLQHLPRRALVLSYLAEFARVLTQSGEAFVQLPVLDPTRRARGWRALAGLAVPVVELISREASRSAAFRGSRLTERELTKGLARAGLRVVRRVEGPDAPYRYSRDVFLRLAAP
ncbi:MAG: class I SAM-dependent methyltransferase [Actinobacteria bacterium]|nr:class I SAM-dependent methyltransferase [Actinomycetota bacterium]